jgi:hypothetical protein
MKKALSTLSANAVVLLLSAPIVFAAADSSIDLDPCAPTTGTGKNTDIQTQLCKLNTSGTGGLVRNVIIAALVIAAVISLFFLIFGGIKWILSGGDKGKVTEARGTIVAALVGLIITFLAYFLLSLVLGLFGLNISSLKLLTP